MFTFIRLFSYLQLYDFQIRIKYWMLQAGMRIWAEMPLSAIGLAILSLALHSHLKISGWSSISWIDLEFRQNRENSYKALAPLRTLTGLNTEGYPVANTRRFSNARKIQCSVIVKVF